jgi:hypothetical protein
MGISISLTKSNSISSAAVGRSFLLKDRHAEMNSEASMEIS